VFVISKQGWRLSWQQLKLVSRQTRLSKVHDIEILHMMHPQPMGPFKIVEIDGGQIVRVLEEVDTKFALNISEYGQTTNG
jgi:hypothetical protein